jgi:hypothetical protein
LIGRSSRKGTAEAEKKKKKLSEQRGTCGAEVTDREQHLAAHITACLTPIELTDKLQTFSGSISLVASGT